ncbi:MAG: tail fiber domain-containing protein [SAR324 cluster bacterium]|nr:tail fiber domain-containing protein [SAR324 cluster bacterium]
MKEKTTGLPKRWVAAFTVLFLFAGALLFNDVWGQADENGLEIGHHLSSYHNDHIPEMFQFLQEGDSTGYWETIETDIEKWKVPANNSQSYPDWFSNVFPKGLLDSTTEITHRDVPPFFTPGKYAEADYLGFLYYLGNVGIGTNRPQARLHIDGGDLLITKNGKTVFESGNATSSVGVSALNIDDNIKIGPGGTLIIEDLKGCSPNSKDEGTGINYSIEDSIIDTQLSVSTDGKVICQVTIDTAEITDAFMDIVQGVCSTMGVTQHPAGDICSDVAGMLTGFFKYAALFSADALPEGDYVKTADRRIPFWPGKSDSLLGDRLNLLDIGVPGSSLEGLGSEIQGKFSEALLSGSFGLIDFSSLPLPQNIIRDAVAEDPELLFENPAGFYGKIMESFVNSYLAIIFDPGTLAEITKQALEQLAQLRILNQDGDEVFKVGLNDVETGIDLKDGKGLGIRYKGNELIGLSERSLSLDVEGNGFRVSGNGGLDLNIANNRLMYLRSNSIGLDVKGNGFRVSGSGGLDLNIANNRLMYLRPNGFGMDVKGNGFTVNGNGELDLKVEGSSLLKLRSNGIGLDVKGNGVNVSGNGGVDLKVGGKNILEVRPNRFKIDAKGYGIRVQDNRLKLRLNDSTLLDAGKNHIQMLVGGNKVRVSDNGFFLKVGGKDKIKYSGGKLELLGLNFDKLKKVDSWVRKACKEILKPFCSDRRLKREITPFNNSLDKILRLQGVTFKWNQDAAKVHPWFDHDYTMHGFVAQDFQKVFPDLVSKGSDGFLGIDYMQIAPILVEGIKEQQKQIEEQQEQISALQNELKLLKQSQNTGLKMEVLVMKSFICRKDPDAPFCAQVQNVSHQESQNCSERSDCTSPELQPAL